MGAAAAAARKTETREKRTSNACCFRSLNQRAGRVGSRTDGRYCRSAGNFYFPFTVLLIIIIIIGLRVWKILYSTGYLRKLVAFANWPFHLSLELYLTQAGAWRFDELLLTHKDSLKVHDLMRATRREGKASAPLRRPPQPQLLPHSTHPRGRHPRTTNSSEQTHQISPATIKRYSSRNGIDALQCNSSTHS